MVVPRGMACVCSQVEVLEKVLVQLALKLRTRKRGAADGAAAACDRPTLTLLVLSLLQSKDIREFSAPGGNLNEHHAMLTRQIWRGRSCAPYQGSLRRSTGLPRQTWRRCASSETGDHKTGHIEAGPNEGVIFFNSTYIYLLNMHPAALQDQKPYLSLTRCVPALGSMAVSTSFLHWREHSVSTAPVVVRQ